MDHLSLTCSLSHRLYCPVLSLCHQCVFTLRQWMEMDHLSLTCSLSHRLYCPVLSLCHQCVFTLRQWMGMDHLSLTCSLSHILYCPVLSLCHQCVFTLPAVDGNGPSLSPAVCHIDIRLYCPVLSSSHPSVGPLYMQWMGMDNISPTCSLSHALYRPLLSSHAWCCCHLLFAISGSRWPCRAYGRYRLSCLGGVCVSIISVC